MAKRTQSNISLSFDKNIYVLFCLQAKEKQLLNNFNKYEQFTAFSPLMEYYRRDFNSTAVKTMFPGYVFVETDLGQSEFDLFLQNMAEEKSGLIRELKHQEVSALNAQELELFRKLLNTKGVLKMSQASIVNGRARVTSGPLKSFESNIVKLDRHNRLAVLDLAVLDREISAGLFVK